MARMPGYKSALLTYPNEGAKCLEILLVIGATGQSGSIDLFEEMAQDEISAVQSVWIDNTKSLSTFELDFPGIQNGYRITVQPGHQGWYPVAAPIGVCVFSAFAAANTSFTIIFANVCMPYNDWGPISGVLQVPTLIPLAANFNRVGDGNILAIAPVVGKSIQVYRANLWLNGAAIVKFQGSGGGDLTGPMNMFNGALLNWQPSGVPWISTPVGEGLTIVLSGTGGGAVVLGGTLGYQTV